MAQNKLFCARSIPGAPFVRTSIKHKKLSEFEQTKVGKVILLVHQGYPHMILTAPKRKGEFEAKCPFGTKKIHIDSPHELSGRRRRHRR
jgi:hypothetical protein